MKITVFEARAFAIQRLNDVLVKPAAVNLVFTLDDRQNERIIAALVKGLGDGKVMFLLIQFGMADNLSEAKKLVEKATTTSQDKQN